MSKDSCDSPCVLVLQFLDVHLDEQAWIQTESSASLLEFLPTPHDWASEQCLDQQEHSLSSVQSVLAILSHHTVSIKNQSHNHSINQPTESQNIINIKHKVIGKLQPKKYKIKSSHEKLYFSIQAFCLFNFLPKIKQEKWRAFCHLHQYCSTEWSSTLKPKQQKWAKKR